MFEISYLYGVCYFVFRGTSDAVYCSVDSWKLSLPVLDRYDIRLDFVQLFQGFQYQ